MRIPSFQRGAPPNITTTTVACWPMLTPGDPIASGILDSDIARYGGVQRHVQVVGASMVRDRATVDKSNDLDGTDTYLYHNESSARDTTTMQGAWTITVWAYIKSSFVGPDRGFFASYGGSSSSESSANNFQAAVGYDDDFQLITYWEHGSGTNVDVHTSSAQAIQNKWTCYSFVKTDDTVSSIKFYVNGELVETVTTETGGGAITNPDGGGGSSVRWRLGAAQGYAAEMNGLLATIHVSAEALSAEKIRDHYERGLGLKHDMRNLAKLKIADYDGTLVDMTNYYDVDWVNDITVTDSIDSKMVEMSSTLKKNVGNLSLAYANKISRINRNPDSGSLTNDPFDSSYTDASGNPNSICNINRQCNVITSRLPPEVQPENNDYYSDFGVKNTLFDGYIDDVNWGDPSKVVIKARDLGTKLRDAFVEVEIKAPASGSLGGGGCGATAAPSYTAMNDIISDAAATYTALSGVSVEVVDDPAFCVFQYVVARASVLTAITEIPDQIGFIVRYRWSQTTDTFTLQLLEPNRTITNPVVTIWPKQVLGCDRVSLKLDDIRNVIKVKYHPEDDYNYEGSGILTASLTSTVAASVTKYGRRYMELSFSGSGNLINSTVEATKLADAIANDLSEPKAEQSMSMPIQWWLEVNDFVRIKRDGVRFTTDENFALYSISHLFKTNSSQTSITLRGKPASGFDVHHQKATFGIEDVVDISDLASSIGENMVDGLAALNAIPVQIKDGYAALMQTSFQDMNTGTFTDLKAYETTNSGFQTNSMSHFATPDGWHASGTAGAWNNLAKVVPVATGRMGANVYQVSLDAISQETSLKQTTKQPCDGVQPIMIAVECATSATNTVIKILVTFYRYTVAGTVKTEINLGFHSITTTGDWTSDQEKKFYAITTGEIEAALTTGGHAAENPQFYDVDIEITAPSALPTGTTQISHIEAWQLTPAGRAHLFSTISPDNNKTWLLLPLDTVQLDYTSSYTPSTTEGDSHLEIPYDGIYILEGTVVIQQLTTRSDMNMCSIFEYSGAGDITDISNWDIFQYGASSGEIDEGDNEFAAMWVSTGIKEFTKGKKYAIAYWVQSSSQIDIIGGSASTASFLTWRFHAQKGLR